MVQKPGYKFIENGARCPILSARLIIVRFDRACGMRVVCILRTPIPHARTVLVVVIEGTRSQLNIPPFVSPDGIGVVFFAAQLLFYPIE